MSQLLLPNATSTNSSQARNFWNPTKTLLFIREYQHHEVLWNVRHPHYRLGSARELAYEVLGRVLGKPVMSKRMVMARIGYLRRRYSLRMRQQEMQALNGSNIQLGDSPDWFILMSEFMPSALQKRPPNRGTAGRNSLTQQPDSPNHIAQNSQPRVTISTASTNSASTNRLDDTTNSTIAVTTESERLGRQWDILQQLDRNVQQSMLELRELQNDAVKTSAEKSALNEFSSFSRDVSAQLSRLPLNEALHCQLAIQGVLHEFRFRQQQHPQQQSQQQHQSQQQSHQQHLQQQEHQLRQPIQTNNEASSEVFEISTVSHHDNGHQLSDISTSMNNVGSRSLQTRPMVFIPGQHNIDNEENDATRLTVPNDLMIVDIVSDTDEDEN